MDHEAAHRWFEAQGRESWATCPLTENGVVRIVSHPNYPGAPGSPAAVAAIVAEIRTLAGHNFWPDDISLVAAEHVETKGILTSGRVTDNYLLALAVAHAGRLATFDRRMPTKAVKVGKAALHLISGQ